MHVFSSSIFFFSYCPFQIIVSLSFTKPIEWLLLLTLFPFNIVLTVYLLPFCTWLLLICSSDAIFTFSFISQTVYHFLICFLFFPFFFFLFIWLHWIAIFNQRRTIARANIVFYTTRKNDTLVKGPYYWSNLRDILFIVLTC